MFLAKIPSTSSFADGCIFLNRVIFPTAIELIISGAEIQGCLFWALGWFFFFDKTIFYNSKNNKNYLEKTVIFLKCHFILMVDLLLTIYHKFYFFEIIYQVIVNIFAVL